MVVRGDVMSGPQRPVHRLADRPQATVRLLGLPHGGGDATFFRSWANRLPAHVEVLAARYPGRRDRVGEPCATDLGALADELAGALEPLRDKPIALFGHSMGAMVGYELAVRMQAAGTPPLLLAVSGRAAPHRAGTGAPGDDAAVAAAVRRLGGPDLDRLPGAHRAPALDLLRADLTAAGRYPGRTGAPLYCPVHAVTGDADPAVTVPAMGGWRTVTTGPFSLTVLPGGHFALVAAEAEVTALLAAALDTPPTPCPAPPPAAPPKPPPTAVPPRRARAHPPAVEDSPCIEKLRAGRETVATFWADRAAHGTPIVEPRGDGTTVLTFVWRGAPGTRRVLLLANELLDRTAPERSLLRHLDGTDVWHLAYRLPADWRGSYQFVPDTDGTATLAELAAAAPRADPYNPLVLPAPGDHTPKSVAEAETAPRQRFCWPRPDLPRGRVAVHHPPAPSLGEAGRRTWVYTPYGHRGDTGTPAVLVVLDGRMWAEELRLATTLDTLIADGLLPPLVALLPDTPDRAREYTCHPPLARFLCDDLLPWAVASYGIPSDPRRTVIAGQSLGGLAAVHAALCAPQRFGHVVAESGSFWWTDDDRPERLTRLVAQRPRLPLRFWLDAGTDEGDRPDPPDRFAEALHAKGYPLRMHRFSGGHDRACWMGEFGERLAELGQELR